MSEQQTPQQHFEIQKVYLKDVSLETPNSPMIFTEQWQPQTEVRLETGATPLTEDLFEAVLTLTVTAKLGERTAYLAEIKQAGLFTLRGFDEQQRGHMLHAFCQNILFPFAREELASLIGKGGFPALLLNPINFDALYLQRLQQQQQQQPPEQAATAASPTPH
jgi:preprotein translocase subunit SecB